MQNAKCRNRFPPVSLFRIQTRAQLAAGRNPRLLAGGGDGPIRFVATTRAQHLDHTASEDPVEEAFSVDIRGKDLLRRGTESAQEIVELRVLRADELLQILLQRAGNGGRLAAGGYGAHEGGAPPSSRSTIM